MILHPSLNPDISCVNPLLVSGTLLLVLKFQDDYCVSDFNNFWSLMDTEAGYKLIFLSKS